MNRVVVWGIRILLLGSIIYTSFVNFLLYHVLIELFSIIVAFSITIIAYNTYDLSKNNYYLFIGIAYSFVGFYDLVHTLTYQGMGIFPSLGANPATQLWIIARYAESISLAVAPLFIKRKLPVGLAAGLYAFSCIVLMVSVFSFGLFPDCFIDGVGLTPFKIVSEYIIVGILLIALLHHRRHRSSFPRRVILLLQMALAATIAAELSFTFYVDVYGLSNIVGHVFKLVSFYLIYEAVIVQTLRDPFSSLFRQVTQQQESLAAANAIIQQDIRKAGAIHQQILPKSLPTLPNYELYSYYQPAQYIGGDFYYAVRRGDRVLVYLSDVIGHGIDGALLNVFLRGTILDYETRLADRDERVAPAQLLSYLQKRFSEEGFPPEYFICIAVLVLDLGKHTIQYSNAGIQVPLLVKDRDGRLFQIELPGMPIHNLSGLDYTYSEHHQSMEPGSSLLLATDGIIEQEENRVMYGESRLRQSFAQAPHHSAEEAGRFVAKCFGEFSPAETADDITFLILTRHV